MKPALSPRLLAQRTCPHAVTWSGAAAAEQRYAASARRYPRCRVPRPVQSATLSSRVVLHKRYSMIARVEKRGTLPSRRRESGEAAEAPQLSTCRLLDALCKTGTRSANTVSVHSPDEGKSGLPRAPAISYVSCFGVCRLLWLLLSFACWRRALPLVSAWAAPQPRLGLGADRPRTVTRLGNSPTPSRVCE